jgi:MoxR-like ATPase
MKGGLMIKTKLKGRKDLFFAMKVAEDVNCPLLLVGEKGTGKTQAFLDYASSLGGKTFILQLSSETRVEDILGYINIPALKEGRVERVGGIEGSEYILLDEIDKANSSVRNLFLSILRERKVFNGGTMVDVPYRLIVGTANSIENLTREDEPFLDRFVMNWRVERLTERELSLLIDPQEEEIEFPVVNASPVVSKDLVLKVIPHIRKYVSDRKLTYLKKITEAILKFKNVSEKDAIALSCIYLTGNSGIINELSDILIDSQYISKAKSLLKDFENASDEETKSNIFTLTVQFVKDIKKDNSIKDTDKQEAINILKPVLDYMNT